MRWPRCVVIKGIRSDLQTIVMPAEIESRRIAAGNIKPDPMAFTEHIAGRPDFYFEFIHFARFNGFGVFMGVVRPMIR